LNKAVPGAVDLRALNSSSEDDGNWRAIFDPSAGRYYFANEVKGSTTWKCPWDLDLEKESERRYILENLTLCIQAAKANGCAVAGKIQEL
jgi:hypothetical protein